MTIKLLCFVFGVLVGQGLADPLIVAHRGASHDAPENTLPAFKLAWEQDADAIEGDFHLTKDGHLVCIHDPTTKKYCPVDLKVSKTDLKDLRKLDVGLYKGEKYKGARIPTISEVLKTVPKGKKIYIEMKTSSTKAIPVLLSAIHASKLEDSQVVVISFNADFLRALKKKTQKYKTFWLVNFREKSKVLHPDFKSTLLNMKAIQADGLSTNAPHLTHVMIGEIKQAGFQHHVWTVDAPEVAEVLDKWGTQSITTNRPKLIKTALNSSQ